MKWLLQLSALVLLWAPPAQAELAGRHYMATVPDTLDLVERVHLSLKPLLAYAVSPGADPATCGPKFLESLVFLRIMTGDMTGLDVEQRGFDFYEKRLGEDGLY